MAGYRKSGIRGLEGLDPFYPTTTTNKNLRKEGSSSEATIGRVQTSSSSSTDQNLQNQQKGKRSLKILSLLHNQITGEVANDNEFELKECLESLYSADRLPQELQNEAKLNEKLKLYLIKQGKDAEAKQLHDLYSQLKKSRVFKNRGGVLNLFYELFDKGAAAKTIEQTKRKSEAVVPSFTVTERFQRNVKSISEVARVEPDMEKKQTFAIPKLMTTVSSRNVSVSSNNSDHVNRDKLRENVSARGSNRSLASNITLRVGSTKAAMEKELIKDMLFIFQGINTVNIKLVETKEKYQILTTKNVHPSMKLQIYSHCEIGYLYRKIRRFCDKPSTGQMTLGLKHGLEKELNEYYKLLVLIQEQMDNNDVDTPISDQVTKTGEEMTLQKLSVFVIDVKFKLEALVVMIDAVEGKKGGEMCSVLYRYSQFGDPLVSSLTVSLLSIVAKPLYNMICQWILYGELEDHFMEFFIASDKDCKKENLWHAKFHIRENMLPSFISRKTAEKILSTGKNINFLRDICLNSKGYEGRNEIRKILEDTPVECMFVEDDRILNNAIERAYKTTSEMVLKVLIEESRLIDHLKAIKNYLLLGQGDFIQYLLHLLQDELSKPASKLFNHNLASILESAIRATNAQFEDEDILARVDTRILQGSDKDTGWDVFCLDYKAQGPIGTVLTDDVITRYNRLFNTLWRTKRIEGILSSLWKNQTTLFKYQTNMPEIGPVLHRSQLLISEMIHFVHQTQYYIMFEATECTWDKLLEEVCRATDLDQVIKAHSIFLENITKRSLLDDGKRELLNQLRGIFETVYKFQSFLTKFDTSVSSELERRKQKKTGTYTRGASKEDQKDFFTNYVSLAKGEIEALYDTTQDLIRSFLLVLNRQQDSDSMTLQCLSFRLDFNEHYGRKDARLSIPLTYHHRRLSSTGYGSPLCQSMTGLTSSLPAPINVSPFLTLTSSLPIDEFEEY